MPRSAGDEFHDFAVVDVFADEPLTGNPLAVVTDADDLAPERTAAIAVEFGLSETTFVTAPTRPDADWRLRSFTRGGEEVTGAGHNALGAWWWLVTSGRATAPSAVQELGGRVLPVQIDAPAAGPLTIGLAQGAVDLTAASVDAAAVLDALALNPAALDESLELVCGSVGSVHLLLPVVSAALVDAADPDGAALRGLLAGTGAQGCYLYTTDRDTTDPGSDAYARFVNPTVGIAEDPATGSAAGPLARHLANHGRAGRRVTIRQGRVMGRPSTLSVTVDTTGTTLFGRCALSAVGRLHV